MFSAARSGSEGRVGSRGSGSASEPSARSLEEVGERGLVGVHRRPDRDLDQLALQVASDSPGVPLCFSAGMRRGHHHAAHVLRPDRVCGEQRHQGGVDPAREGEADVAEAVLADVVAQAEDERLVDLLEVGQRLRHPGRAGGGQLADQQLLLELGGAGDHRAARVDDEALAVEDQLVLAADQVAEGEMGAVGAGAGGEHLLALASLAAVVGGARGVRDQLGARRRLGRGGRALDPAVLADRQPDLRPGDLDRLSLAPRDEVALLVEDGVVGEAVLAVDGGDLPVGEHREGVVGAAEVTAPGSRLGEADQDDHPAHLRRDLLDRPPVGLDEVPLQVEVLGGIARHAELGEDRQVGALRAGAADPLGHLGGVAVDVADGRVDLGQCYAHACSGRSIAAGGAGGDPRRPVGSSGCERAAS